MVCDGVTVQIDKPLIHLRVVSVVGDLGLPDSARHTGHLRDRGGTATLWDQGSRGDQCALTDRGT